MLGVSEQAHIKWRANPVTQRGWDDAHLLNATRDVHHDDPEFGYRLIRDELAERGVHAGRNRVNRLCTLQRLWSAHSRKRGRQRVPARQCMTTSSSASVLHYVHSDRCCDDCWHLGGRGQAVPLRGQGRLLRTDRRLVHRRPDDLHSWRSTRCATP